MVWRGLTFDHASSLPHRKQQTTVCRFLKTIHTHSLAQRDVYNPQSPTNMGDSHTGWFFTVKVVFVVVFLKCLIKSHSVDVLAFTHTFPLFSCLLQSLFIVAVCEAALRWVVWKSICALTLKKALSDTVNQLPSVRADREKVPSLQLTHWHKPKQNRYSVTSDWDHLVHWRKRRTEAKNRPQEIDDQKSWHNLEFKDAGTTWRQQEVGRHSFAIKGS